MFILTVAHTVTTNYGISVGKEYIVLLCIFGVGLPDPIKCVPDVADLTAPEYVIWYHWPHYSIREHLYFLSIIMAIV